MADKDEHRVLKGHVPQGLKFVPKILALGEFNQQFNEVPYVRVILPELIWLALLNQRLGNEQGAKVVEIVASAVKQTTGHKRTWFAAVSCCTELSDTAKQNIAQALDQNGLRKAVSGALQPFVELYPEFPGAFLVVSDPSRNDLEFLPELKKVVDNLYDTESGAAVFMCASAVYAAFCLDILKVNPNVSLAKFPEIEKYPSTELSKRVAAACRATSLQMVGQNVIQAQLTTWSSYFWNRGLELEPMDWSAMRAQS